RFDLLLMNSSYLSGRSVSTKPGAIHWPQTAENGISLFYVVGGRRQNRFLCVRQMVVISGFSPSGRTARLRASRVIPGSIGALAVTLTLPLFLAGCDVADDDMRFAPACATVHVQDVLGDYYQYDGSPGIFSHLVTHASIVRVKGECIASGIKNESTRIGLHMVVMRGPAAKSNTVTLPWFVAVVHNDKIVGKHVYQQTVTFPPGTDSLQFDGRVGSVDLPVRPVNTGNDYIFEIGFQLSKDQVKYNREHNVRASFSPL
ncbi:hypothetical protein LOC54_06800, partial [Acetobacter sp. AN02]|uniref:hypothetical protein n=1 Tax=Acetobacter sp. AN02 TaxID=2894186 RepID=UPI0024343F80